MAGDQTRKLIYIYFSSEAYIKKT